MVLVDLFEVSIECYNEHKLLVEFNEVCVCDMTYIK